MTTAANPRAAIYVRISDTKQEYGASLDTQLEACRRYSRDQGWSIDEAHVYREIHTGDELRERPRLTALREAVQRRAVDVVLCYAVDRLTRNQAHMYILVDELERRGVRLEFVTEKFEDTPVGKFILSAKTFAAEIERQKLIERTYRGTVARARSGKPLVGPRPPYGYQWNADKSAFVIDPVTAPVVQRIFREALAGKTLRQIALGLARDGISSPGGKPHWEFTTVRLILRKRLYIGEATAFRTSNVKLKGGGVKQTIRPESEQIAIAGVAPALTECATFAAVQQRLRLNQQQATRNNKTPENALLRAGYVRCGHCGRSMGVDTQQKHGKPSYRCTDKSMFGGCGGACIHVHALDGEVWQRVERVLTNPDLIAEQIRRLRESDPTEEELRNLDRTLAEIARQQDKAARAITMLDEDSAVPLMAQLKTLGERRRALEAERQSILAQRAGWEADQQRLERIRLTCQGIAAEVQGLGYQERRLALQALGVGVKVYRAGYHPRWEISMSFDFRDDIAFTSANA